MLDHSIRRLKTASSTFRNPCIYSAKDIAELLKIEIKNSYNLQYKCEEKLETV